MKNVVLLASRCDNIPKFDKSSSRVGTKICDEQRSQDCIETFFVDGHLDCEVRVCVVYWWVVSECDCILVTTVSVARRDGADCECRSVISWF
jgi:hypothetical protein